MSYRLNGITGLLERDNSSTPTGDVTIGSGNAFYFGSSTTNGSWRIIRDGNNLSFQRREGGTWVEKGAMQP